MAKNEIDLILIGYRKGPTPITADVLAPCSQKIAAFETQHACLTHSSPSEPAVRGSILGSAATPTDETGDKTQGRFPTLSRI